MRLFFQTGTFHIECEVHLRYTSHLRLIPVYRLIAEMYTVELKRNSYEYGGKSSSAIRPKTGFGFHQLNRKVTKIDVGSAAHKSEINVGDIIHSCRITDSISGKTELISEEDDINTKLAFSVNTIILNLVRGGSIDEKIGKYPRSKVYFDQTFIVKDN